MKAALVVAAVLAVLLAGAHSYLGERYILIRLFRRDSLPKLFGGVEFTRNTLRFAWHLTSVAWMGFAGLLLGMASPSPLSAQHVIAGTFAASGILALVGSRGRHPAWVVFFAIAALAWLAS